jgi:predicted phage terminase large subunit-like protein
MKLTPELIEGFVEVFLKPRFDNPAPIPEFHRTLWAICCSDSKNCAIAAPRGFAKSTSITHSYLLAALLFGDRKFALIVSDTETQAISFLNDIKVELKENEELIREFGIHPKFLRDTESDISVVTKAGRFRIVARGTEQKVRGLKWRGKRPDLVICDDMENDEQVMNKERREKVRNWFLNALLPAGGDHCIYRVAGTILHMDSLLERLLSDGMWESRRFKAHGEHFRDLLWPEKFPRERLMQIRSMYVSQGNLEGYSQEYLNMPVAEENAYFKKEWFVPMESGDYIRHQRKRMSYYISADLAVSKADHADYTAIIVVGVDEMDTICVVDCVVKRLDSMEIINELFDLWVKYDASVLFLEKGVLEKSIGPILNTEMLRRRVYMNIETKSSTNDKITRARSIQGRMKAQMVRFDRESGWFDGLLTEMTQFPRGKHDDRVDAMSLLGQMLDELISPQTQEEEDLAEYQESRRGLAAGRSETCGY